MCCFHESLLCLLEKLGCQLAGNMDACALCSGMTLLPDGA